MPKSSSFAQGINHSNNWNLNASAELPKRIQTNSFTHNPEFESLQGSEVRHHNFPETNLQEETLMTFHNTMGTNNKMMSGNLNFARESGSPYRNDATIDDHWQNLIDWVNSFDDPHCLLISSFNDFNDGIALCHLVS